MADGDAFEALLDDLHAAALGLTPWLTVLDEIARQLGANSAIIHKDRWQGGGWGVVTECDARTYSDYFSHYAGIHPMAVRTMATPAGMALTDRMIMPRTELERTEYYYDWARPNGFVHQLHVRVANDEHALAGLTVTRPRTSSDFSATDLLLGRRIAPHIRRAITTYERFEETRQTSAGMMEAVDRMRRAVFGLGADGRVIFANQTARTMLARGDTLRIDDGALAGIRADQTRALLRMLAAHARGDAVGDLTFDRPDGRPSLRLEPVGLGSVPRLTDLRLKLRLLLMVHDPEVDDGALLVRLRGLYGLTATEAAVAFHIAHGKGLASVATTLGIGPGTVRSHLKRVFEKTRTNRQAELAWVVSKISDGDCSNLTRSAPTPPD